MVFAVLFALALCHIGARFPAYRRVVLAAVTGLLLFELSPFPRPLYSARVPDVYRIIANDPRHIRVLNLPVGFMIAGE